MTGGVTEVTNRITLAAHLVAKKLCTRATYDIPTPSKTTAPGHYRSLLCTTLYRCTGVPPQYQVGSSLA
eukprot:scaffold208813_cov102-Attheya_sp.AAC.1